MNKIMISIKPEWVNKILTKEKTIEIRKSIPKCKLPCEVYIYCTKDKSELTTIYPNSDYAWIGGWVGNGKVVAKFILDYEISYTNKELNFLQGCGELIDILKPTCVSESEFKKYARDNKTIYFWHISNLEILKNPKDLGGFNLKRPPQSWCYIKGV